MKVEIKSIVLQLRQYDSYFLPNFLFYYPLALHLSSRPFFISLSFTKMLKYYLPCPIWKLISLRILI